MNMQNTEAPEFGEPIDDDAVLAEGASWDIDSAARDARERAFAWRTAGGLGVALLVTLFAFSVTTSNLSTKLAQKQAPVPHVWVFNEETRELKRLTRLSDMEIPAREASIKGDLADYVIRRERYIWETIQTDYDAVSLWSSATVGRAYEALYNDRDGRQTVFGEDVELDAEITSGPTLDGEDRATVRFKVIVKRDGRVIGDADHFIATIGFRYDPKAELEEPDRLVDPRSLEVTAYTVQEDHSR